MTESNHLLVACPQCHAWPMAASRLRVKWTFAKEMMFRCARCGHQATFNVTSEVNR
jgi:RNase P subunit RPR2